MYKNLTMNDTNESSTLLPKTINLHNEHDLHFWTKTFQVTLEDIKEAVAKVGASAEEVKFYLWDEPKNNGNNPFYFFIFYFFILLQRNSLLFFLPINYSHNMVRLRPIGLTKEDHRCAMPFSIKIFGS